MVALEGKIYIALTVLTAAVVEERVAVISISVTRVLILRVRIQLVVVLAVTHEVGPMLNQEVREQMGRY